MNTSVESSASLAAWAAQVEQAGAGVAARACRLALSRSSPTPAWRAVQPELLATIALLGELGVGEEAQAACVLHTLMLTDPAVDAGALAEFGEGTRALVEGQQAAERVWALYAAHGTVGGSEGLRRLLLAIIRDLRVVFILLARQLVHMRAATRAPEAEQRALARLTADIHAPLANRLGIWQIKWELEDLAFRFLQPDVYRRIAGLLDERRGDREAWIGDAKARLGEALRAAGIEADIAG
ncbi:MAG TPA: HD domain-containing protein, partial [Dokdonella sp.]|nr:HD domain-containing protein [Dokdonella sp.]